MPEFKCAFCGMTCEDQEELDIHQAVCENEEGQFQDVRMYQLSIHTGEKGEYKVQANTWIEECCEINKEKHTFSTCYTYTEKLDAPFLDWKEHDEPFVAIGTLDLDLDHRGGYLFQCLETLADYLDDEFRVIKAQKEALGLFDIRNHELIEEEP